MKVKRLIITLQMALLAPLGLMAHNNPADTAAQHLVLSLEDAQQYALKHNYALKNASLELQKAEAAKWQTLCTMLPQVSMGYDYSNMLGYSIEFAPGMNIEMNPSGSFNLTAAVALSGAQIVGTMLTEVSRQMSDVSRRQTIQSTYATVKSTYVSTLVMEETMSLLDSSLANLQRLQKTTDAAVAAGASEQIDADKLKVQVATLQSTINSNRRTLQVLYNSLLLQLGANVNSTLELTTTLDEIIDIKQSVAQLSRGFNLNNNFDYQTLLLGEKASKKQVTMAHMELLPTISLFYRHSNVSYFGEDAGFNMTPPNAIGASLSWNIFQSGTRAAKIRSAKLDYENFLNTKQQAEDGLKVQYNQASFDLVNAIETYNIQKENIDVSQRVFQNISEKYKYGRASSLEVTNASTDLISAQSSYIQAVISVVNAQVALEKLQAENQYDDMVLPYEKGYKENQ